MIRARRVPMGVGTSSAVACPRLIDVQEACRERIADAVSAAGAQVDGPEVSGNVCTTGDAQPAGAGSGASTPGASS